ncbi:MAG: hypothetical protein JRG84_02305 [Deltaproteobacteria bacterium]|nr:hypothetical protein [Deltaproteobacteria bacterium]
MALAGGTPRIATALALCALVAALYWPARQHEWLNYDDDVYVTALPEITLGISREGVAWAFSTFQGSNWFPLTRLSWMLDYELAGLDAKRFHTTNLLLHALAAAVLFLALSRLTGARWRSAFAAAVFGLHPLAVEPVAWAAGRKDPLAGLFFALALWAYAAQDGRLRGPLRVAPVFLLLLLGLLSKQTLVTFPFVLLLLDVWPLGRLRRAESWDRGELRRALLEKLPLFALVAAFSVVTLVAQSSTGIVADLERLPLAQRLGNAAVALVTYLGNSVAPVGLAVFYPHPGDSLSALRVALALLTLAGLGTGAWRCRQRAPALTVGALWFAGMLVPVLGIVQVGDQALADRYMYLPLVGLAIAATWGVPELLLRGRPELLRRNVLAVAGLCVLAALAWTTSRQLAHWRTSETLMQHALDVTGENYVAYSHLGEARLAQGDAAGAAAHWRDAARVEPRYATVANNLAWLLATHPDATLRDGDEAVRLAERAAALSGDTATTLDTLAAAYAEAGRGDAAIATAERALSSARAAGQEQLAAQIETRLARYRSGRAWREPSRSGS